MNRYPVLTSSVNVNAKGIKNFKVADTDNIPHQKLSNAEMNKLEIPKEVYIIIRLADVIEKCYNLDKISSEEYNSQMGKLLQKYQNLTTKIKDFQLINFVHEYGLEECTWALDRLQKGLQNSLSNSATNERALFVKITAKFHDINDTLFLNQSKTQLITIKGPLEDLISYLKKAEKQLGNDFKGLKFLEDFLSELISKRNNLNDILSKDEVDQLQAIVGDSFNGFMRAIGE